MDMNEYQQEAMKTMAYPPDEAITYPALGLAGEAGEVCNKVKKHLRGDLSLVEPLSREVRAVIEEIGDVLWYCANLANDLGWDLDQVARINIDKCARRRAAGTIKGSGDDR